MKVLQGLKKVDKIIFLPTAQHQPDSPWLMNERGRLRAEAALRCLRENPDAVLIICGGYPNDMGFTYADRTAYMVANLYPEMIKRLVMVSGVSNRTITDLFYGLLTLVSHLHIRNIKITPAKTTVFFCSEEMHYLRCKASIQALGFKPKFVNSLADDSLYSQADKKMAKKVVVGKLFGFGQSSVYWNRNAYKKGVLPQIEQSRNFTINNRDQSLKYRDEIRALQNELISNGCLIQSPYIGIDVCVMIPKMAQVDFKP